MLDTVLESVRAEMSTAAASFDVHVGGEPACLDLELSRAHRVARERLEPEDIAWLCKGFSAFLAGEGKVSLERCLRLPTNERALRRARRDQWLRRAWLELAPELSAWQRSEVLAAEVRRFQSTKWDRWSSLETPPSGATKVDEALFEAFRSLQRVPTTAMQLHNIAGHALDS